MIENKLFWHKFRPTTISNDKGKIKMILLPRIRKIVEKGISMNFLFHGSPGLGKTTLAGILTENTDCLRINCRLDGLDYVRNKTEEHCTHYGVFGSKDKVVWLEEFDGASWQMREALRPLIELYIDNVKFIATANSLTGFNSDKDLAVLSRFNSIKFDPIDDTEKDFLRKNQVNFLKGIASKEKFNLSDEIVNKIVTMNFPDFRRSVQHLQELQISGDVESWEKSVSSRNQELFNFITNGVNKVDENYFYVMDNYKDNSQELLREMGRPLFSYLLERNPKFIDNKGALLIKLQKTYNSEYPLTPDPELHLISMVTDVKDLFKN
jgi:replication-associated recombination protein RarA